MEAISNNKTKTLITQLMGGLGNQMFQYAAARRLALEKNRRLLVDTSILEDHTNGQHEVNRKYALEIFNLQVQKTKNSERWIFNAHGLPLFVKLINKTLKPLTKKYIYINKIFRYDDKLFKVSPTPHYIQGLWQSYKYLMPIADQLKKDFEFKKTLPKEFEELKKSILRSVSVCLNIRRGDYLKGSSAKNMSYIDIDYFRAAKRKMEDLAGLKLKIFVFSDDIEWCNKNLLKIGNNTKIVSHEYAGNHFGAYLQLMSLCKKFIIPNSTFAWWAAWLANAPEKHVIAPARWFIDSTINTQDLCPPEWIRI